MLPSCNFCSTSSERQRLALSADINTKAKDMFIELSSCHKCTLPEFTGFINLMNAGDRQAAADPLTKIRPNN